MTTLWVGGTSALAATYFEEQLDIATGAQKNGRSTTTRSFVLAAPHPPEPSWSDLLSRSSSRYVPLDMTCRSSIDEFFATLQEMKMASCITTIIFGMRASLIAGCEIDHLSMTNNIAYFLDTASVYFPELAGVLHVSSVAVMNHTQPQHMLNEDAPLPALASYQSPYDVMKRTTEEVIADSSQKNNIRSVQLRISGIFSNEIGHNCIQMSAIRLQAYVGCYIRTPLDMNTGLNVCHAIRLLLERMEESPSSPTMSRRRNDNNGEDGPSRLRSIYYYTRPTIEPKPYGQNLVDYRRAHGICLKVDVWEGFARPFLWAVIYCFGKLATLNQNFLCILDNIAYLLTVSLVEHTFDCSRIREDFPELTSAEETTFEGFARIKKRREERARSD